MIGAARAGGLNDDGSAAAARKATGGTTIGVWWASLKLVAGSRMSPDSTGIECSEISHRRPRYIVGSQGLSTKTASLWPGHGGIVAPIMLSGSCPSQRNWK